ncbi:MAG: hypothetical protein ACK5EE_03970, partial [Ignavibacteria bacterium]
ENVPNIIMPMKAESMANPAYTMNAPICCFRLNGSKRFFRLIRSSTGIAPKIMPMPGIMSISMRFNGTFLNV